MPLKLATTPSSSRHSSSSDGTLLPRGTMRAMALLTAGVHVVASSGYGRIWKYSIGPRDCPPKKRAGGAGKAVMGRDCRMYVWFFTQAHSIS